MMILSYYADDATQDWIDLVIKHDGTWQNPEQDFYCIHEPSQKTVTMFALLGVDYWYEEIRQN